MIGQTISHYKILEKLGEGGMGEVWKAQDTRLDRMVAVKFVPEKTAEDAQTVERFLREARAASALNHPHICTIFDVGEWERRRYIVMELVDGATLRDRVIAGPLDMETVVEIGIQLADALDAAHARNIVHRDIKATNIMLSDRGRATILDFGLAKIVMSKEGQAAEDAPTMVGDRDLTDAGQAVGTVSTMSPEQALGKDVDGRSDIFSLGVVLYEIATGKQAFTGSTSAAVFDAILNRAPVAPVKLNPSVPPEFERILNKMLEKDRDLRYQNASDVTTDLKRMRRDSGSQMSASVSAARQASGSQTAAAPSRGGAGKWIGIAAGVAVIAVAAVGVMKLTGGGGGSREPLGSFKTRPLTGAVGVEGNACWSPDGSFVAYSHSAAGPMDIFVMAASGGEPIHLVESPGDDGFVSWSPDNKWIAYLSGVDGTLGIYIVPPLGGQSRRVVRTEIPPLDAGPMIGPNAWSPDGSELLYAKPQGAGFSASLHLLNVNSGEDRELLPAPEQGADMAASWSFDGKRIAFLRVTFPTFQARIMTVSPDGTDLREEYAREDMMPPVAWTPDSKSLVFASARTGNSDIWVLRLGDKEPRPLTMGGGDEGGAVVSRNGDVLYNTFSHQTDLYLMDLNTREEKRLTAHTQDNFGARFSPDGREVAYMSSRTGQSAIWLLNLESGTERKLTESQGRGPEWSRDGREVFYVTDGDGGSSIWAAPADGGTPRKLVDVQGGGSLRVTPDGTHLGYVALEQEKPRIMKIPVEGGEPVEVFSPAGFFEWYQDDRHVIVAGAAFAEAGAGELRAVDLDSGEMVTLWSEPQIEFELSPDGTALTYCSARSHYNMNLFRLPLERDPATGLPRPAGDPEQLTHGDGEWHVHNGDWSPDGTRLVYTRDTDTGDLFVMEGVFKGVAP